MVFFFAVFAAIDFILRICQYKDMVQALLDGSDTPGVLAADHIGDLFGKMETFFLYDLIHI